MTELKKVLAENPDPMMNVLGTAYGQGADLIEVYNKSTKASLTELNTCAVLQSFNRALLASGNTLSPDSVEYAAAEISLLKGFAGIDADKMCVEAVGWENAYVSESGLRAPPWRHSAGDLGYIALKPFDTDALTVLVNTEGYWEIVGHKDGAMDYSKVGDSYPNLISLCKARSPHFSDMLAKQDTAFQVSHSAKAAATEIVANQNRDEPATLKKTRGKRGAGRTLMTSGNWTPFLGDSRVQSAAGPTAKSGDETAHGGGADADEDDGNPDDEEDLDERRPVSHADLPAEYWLIHKYVKYLTSGNQTATIIALCSFRDLDLSKDTCQFAIQDVKGLDVLVNLLDAADLRCQIGALQILKEVSKSPLICQAIADLDGMRAMVAILDAEDDGVRALSAATIANCATLTRNRKKVRQYDGVPKLVKLLHGSALENNSSTELERSGALALWSCSKSPAIRRILLETEAMELISELIKTDTIPLLVPVIGIVGECAEEEAFREVIRDFGIIPHIVKRLNSENEELQAHSASAIFKCGEDAKTRVILRDCDGIKPLVQLLAKVNNKEMLAGVTGAIWKCALDEECNRALADAKAVESLVPLLNDQPEEVLVNVVGALSELATDAASRKTLRANGGVDQLVKLLTGTNQALLINVTKAVGMCAKDKDSMAVIDKQDGVRLLWSLLKSPTPEVQSGAAWAICPCIELAPDAGEMVRSFVGGLELIVGLLRSEHIEVLASVCAAVAQIAKDEENLAVITDYGVVPMLGRLTPTTDDRLRRHLASAISECCTWGSNRVAFGEADAVAPLVKYLKSADSSVHQSTALALAQLSQNPENCITMHKANVVMPLIAMVGSTDRVLQEASAQCLSNIRRLAMVNELAKNN